MLKVILISVAIAVFGFIPLMGIPGALVFYTSFPFVYFVYGPGAFDAFQHAVGPSMWALALFITLLWPIAIPISYWISQKYYGPAKFFNMKVFIPFFILVLLACTTLSSTIFAMNYADYVS